MKYTWVRYVYSRNQKNLPAGSIHSQAQSHNITNILTVLVLNDRDHNISQTALTLVDWHAAHCRDTYRVTERITQ